jgi:hypothetical protein
MFESLLKIKAKNSSPEGSTLVISLRGFAPPDGGIDSYGLKFQTE